jgi:hypothetical protein
MLLFHVVTRRVRGALDAVVRWYILQPPRPQQGALTRPYFDINLGLHKYSIYVISLPANPRTCPTAGTCTLLSSWV